MTTDDAQRIQALEKANRILQKKLARSELNRVELEKTNDLKESLLRQVIQDLKASEATIEEKNQTLQRQAETLEHALNNLKRTQAQLIQHEKMSSLGQLVAGIAHEINNPTNFIAGNLTFAQDYLLDLFRVIQCYQTHYPNSVNSTADCIQNADLDFIIDDFPKVLQSMQTGVDRIEEIVSSLRTFSRLDEAEIKQINVHDGIDSTLMLLSHRLKSKLGSSAINVVKQYAQLPRIECYAGQLNQVFMNLFSNAIDALEERANQNPSRWRPTITIRTEARSIPEPSIRIYIADNGIGISEAIQPQLFDPFFTTKAIGKGTGLGLSVSYQIVIQQHDGNLSYQSIVGEGTEFSIELPTTLKKLPKPEQPE